MLEDFLSDERRERMTDRGSEEKLRPKAHRMHISVAFPERKRCLSPFLGAMQDRLAHLFHLRREHCHPKWPKTNQPKQKAGKNCQSPENGGKFQEMREDIRLTFLRVGFV